MSPQRIVLTGIRASGSHGANPGERLLAQEFVVDLEVLVDTGDDDSLEATVDYRELIDAARSTVEERSFELIESLAGAVADAVYEFEPVVNVTAVVHKPGAAQALGVADVWVDAQRG